MEFRRPPGYGGAFGCKPDHRERNRQRCVPAERIVQRLVSFSRSVNPASRSSPSNRSGRRFYTEDNRASIKCQVSGVGLVPPVLKRSVIDEVIAVSDADAFACARRLPREEGVLVGVSAGAAIHAARTTPSA
jgi:hypothetical protein